MISSFISYFRPDGRPTEDGMREFGDVVSEARSDGGMWVREDKAWRRLPIQMLQYSSDSDQSLTVTDNDLGSVGTITIPEKGFIEIRFTGRWLDTSAASNDLVLGVKVGGSYFYPTYDDDGGGATNAPIITTGASAYREFTGGASYNNARGGLVFLDIEALGLPTGQQEVTIAARPEGTGTLKGATTTTRIYMTVQDFD